MARILVIEDNSANLELMVYLLRAGGHETITAEDGGAGLAAAGTASLDIIVCDVHLPVLDGYQVAQRLKADPALRAIPLVAVTALAMVGDKEKVLAAGFDGYIAKPIDPRAFVAEVEAFLPAGARPAAGRGAETAAPGEAPPAVAAAAAGGGPRILVVDDSPVNRELARATLEPFGYRVTVAAQVSEAVRLLAERPFDLVLSDVHMPDDTGLSLLALVRADPRWRQLPFVLISSSVWGTAERERGRDLGATRFLTRPINPRRLLAEVAACLAAGGVKP